MSRTPPSIECVACSILRSELEALRKSGEIDFPIHYLTSMLHMRPSELRRRLDAVIREPRRPGSQILLVYGECHDHMSELEADVCRVRGRNCVEMVLGPEQYRKLRGEGVFFLMPEWAIRWREFFESELGLAGETRRDLMRDMHTKLLYLDTGQVPIPTECLREASDALGLPWEIMPVGPEHLLAAIRQSRKGMGSDAP